MFWTAFIWGLGATLGGSFGVMAFVIMHDGWSWITQRKAVRRSLELAEMANDALVRRNELTQDQIDAIKEISRGLE